AMSFPNGLLPTSEAVHPTPLYESFLSFVLFTFLHWGFSLPSSTSGRTRAVGTRFAVTLGLYGVVRMSIEPWRRHPVSDYLLGLTEYQFLAVIFILLGGVLALAGRGMQPWPLIAAASEPAAVKGAAKKEQ
ncbi:unnamed protein product, partial [Polarella glacialis]